jgi:hypothetical protein
MNNMQRNIPKISEGKAHCRNAIRIEIPTVKLQKNRGRIISIDVDFMKNEDH